MSLSGCAVVNDQVGGAQTGGLLSKEPAPGRERTIDFFNVFGGVAGAAWVQMAALYEQQQTHTGVRVTYAPLSADTQVRLLTSIAAGNPPDVAFVQPEQYPQFSGLGVTTDLGPYLKESGLGEKDFVSAVWDQMTRTGSVYAIPGMVDPNFPLFYNRTLFAENGLDPDAPPQTIEDIDRISEVLLAKSGNNVTQVGTVPWTYYGYSNSMFTLGFAFGGEFVNADNTMVTPDHPGNIQALEWMVDYGRRIGGAGRIAVSPPGQSLPVMATGNVGMMPMTTLDAGNVFTNAPEVDLGSTLFPYAEGLGTRGGATWLGGWSLFIPSEAKNKDSAWDFIRWACTTSEGTAANYEFQNAVPGISVSPAIDVLEGDPQFAVFVDALKNTQNVRPTIPVASTYSQQLDVYVGQAVFGQLSPEQALRRVSDNVNAEWESFTRENS